MIIPPMKEILSKKKYIWTAAILFLMFIILGTAAGRAIPLNVVSVNRVPKDPSRMPQGFSGIGIYANVSNIDTQAYTLRLFVDFRPRGDYLYADDPMKRTLKKPVFIAIDTNSRVFMPYEFMMSTDVVLSIQSGSAENYPFDVYTSEFYIQCQEQNSSSLRYVDVPLSVSIQNSQQDWVTDMRIDSPTANYSLLKVSVHLERSRSQKLFCIFIVFLMWAISLGIFVMSFAHLRYSKRIEAPTLGVVCTMLFALPAVRQTLPGTPIIGCTSDLIGFFWNMGLIAISAILLLWRFSFQDIQKDKESQKKLLPTTAESPVQKSMNLNENGNRDSAAQKFVDRTMSLNEDGIEMQRLVSQVMGNIDLGEAPTEMQESKSFNYIGNAGIMGSQRLI